MKFIYLFIIIMFMLSGCKYSAINNNLFGNYFLVASDVGEDLSLSYHERADGSNYATIIKATVFAAGFNNKYLVVKQHPRTFPSPPNKTITYYYIVPIKKGFDWKNKNGLIGPLTIDQYHQKNKELNVGKIDFNILYKDLE